MIDEQEKKIDDSLQISTIAKQNKKWETNELEKKKSF